MIKSMFLLLPFLISSLAHKLIVITHLFKKLIYETQNNLHQLAARISRLIMWHNKLSENKNETIEVYIPEHQGSKTKKPRHRDSRTKKPRHQDSGTAKPRHCNSKVFFQRTISHDIGILRLENHDIEFPRPKTPDIMFLWVSDPHAPPDRLITACSPLNSLPRISVPSLV